VALNSLGHVTAALGDYETCKACYYEALQIARDIQTIPLTLEALAGLAAPLAQEGQISRAAELLTLALEHPSSTKETRDRAAKFLGRLEKQIEARHTAQSKIQKSGEKLEALVAEVLGEG
jgi:hypothetical protein